MGKRKKSSKPVVKIRREKLPTVFQCLFCNHDKSVTVRLDKKLNIGGLSCKLCGQNYQTIINNLSAPIDVYAAWVDACEEVAQEAALVGLKDSSIDASTLSNYPVINSGNSGNETRNSSSKQAIEMNDFIEQDDLDAEGDYLE